VQLWFDYEFYEFFRTTLLMAFRRPGKTFPLLTLFVVLGIKTPQAFARQTLLDHTGLDLVSEGVAGEVQSPVPQQTPPPQPGQLPPSSAAPGAPTPIGQTEEKRIMGVLPNYRTAEMSAAGTPLTARQKLKIAVKDSFDYPLLFIAAAYSGFYQADDSHPEFGQGAKGYFSRLGTSYADQVDGNMLAEGFLPALFREDPRYFRMNQGPKKQRAWYALTRIVVTRTDSGHSSFNFAEICGNGIAAGIGLSYYPDDRDVGDFLQNWATQLATDAGSQLLKEFWPDIKRKLHHQGH
jgi:hypothetical protein